MYYLQKIIRLIIICPSLDFNSFEIWDHEFNWKAYSTVSFFIFLTINLNDLSVYVLRLKIFLFILLSFSGLFVFCFVFCVCVMAGSMRKVVGLGRFRQRQLFSNPRQHKGWAFSDSSLIFPVSAWWNICQKVPSPGLQPSSPPSSLTRP